MSACKKRSVVRDPEALKLWNDVRPYLEFYNRAERRLQTAANVGIVVEDLDPTDEVLNLLARHNLPFWCCVPRT